MNSNYHLNLNHSDPNITFDQVCNLQTDITSSNKYSQLHKKYVASNLIANEIEAAKQVLQTRSLHINCLRSQVAVIMEETQKQVGALVDGL